MRFPSPIDERRRRVVPPVAVVVVAAAAVAGGVVWATGRDGGTAPPAPEDNGAAAASQPVGASGLASALSATSEPVVVFDGVVTAGEPAEVTVTGRAVGLDEHGLVLLTVTATADEMGTEFAVRPCGSSDAPTSAWPVSADSVEVRHVLVPVGGVGTVCATSQATSSATIELDGFVEAGTITPFPGPVRVVDSTVEGSSADGKFAGIGVRPERSTLRVPMATRFSGLGDVGALLVSVTAVDPLEAGDLAVFAPEAGPAAAALEYEPGITARATALVQVGASGELCVSTTGRTDIVVDVLGLARTSQVTAITPDEGAADECPAQALFPSHRIVALYGTQRSARLGVLGEQTPAEAVERLEKVAEPWRAGDSPVLPAFELIATLATGTPEDRGVYNIRSSPEFVQEYLDVARRNGYYLILDLQTGQSDFLTEAMYYEEFLRQPDVGLALDPEWRTAAPARPKGGRIGTVDAAEVNQVVEYVAQIVAEEDLPEKLIVLHQFEPGMITNRDQIVELPGVAINLHMDGFGPRPEKLNSYDVVRAEPPWNMGLKLFYDEDTDLLQADDVLGSELFDPVPDLISYQ